jgi:hypothetical protein
MLTVVELSDKLIAFKFVAMLTVVKLGVM